MNKGQRLAGKVALVTGIGSGIGQCCALMFARQGARVIGCDIDAAAAEATLALARDEGLVFDSLQPCDLTDPEQSRRLVDYAVELHDGIDILVNAAAFGAFAWIEEMDYQKHWRKTLAGELDLVFLLCQAAWPVLKRNGGSIINFASANAWMALEGSPALAHCAGKGGVLAMTRQLAMEGGPHRIRANSIAPGAIRTPINTAAWDTDKAYADLMTLIPYKRIGEPDDVAQAAVWLASDAADYVTGATLFVDGGMTLYPGFATGG